MCISCELHDKWPPLIEFMIWTLLQGMNIGNHYGVWAIVKSHVMDVTRFNETATNFTTTMLPRLITGMPGTTNIPVIDGSNEISFPVQNDTRMTLEEQWSTLIDFRLMLLVFNGIGTALFLVHACLLMPNVIQSFRVKDPALLPETGNAYFRSVLKIHCTFLILETILFDIPAGCLTMELLSLIWEGPLSEATNMEVSKIILALSLTGLAFIALYKGQYSKLSEFIR